MSFVANSVAPRVGVIGTEVLGTTDTSQAVEDQNRQLKIRAPRTAVCAVCHNAPEGWALSAYDATRSDLLQVLTNLGQQFARAVGFCDVTVATGRMRFAVVAAQSIGSYGDNRNAF